MEVYKKVIAFFFFLSPKVTSSNGHSPFIFDFKVSSGDWFSLQKSVSGSQVGDFIDMSGWSDEYVS